VTVNNGVTTAFKNTASVPSATFNSATAPCTPDPSVCENETAVNQGNNSASVTTSVGGPGIDLVMVNDQNFDTPDPVGSGRRLTNPVVVTNAGTASTSSDPAPNTVVVRTTLPAGLNLQSAAASGGFSCVPVGPTPGTVGDVNCT